MSRLRFEPWSFCAWVQHANHSEPPHFKCCIIIIIMVWHSSHGRAAGHCAGTLLSPAPWLNPTSLGPPVRQVLQQSLPLPARRKSMPTLAVGTSSLQSRLKPWDLWTRQHANSLVIWEGRSPYPQAMTGKELFCSKEFRCLCSASTLSCYMTACQPLTAWIDRSVPNFVYRNF